MNSIKLEVEGNFVYDPDQHGDVLDIDVTYNHHAIVYADGSLGSKLFDAMVDDEPDHFPLVVITTEKGKIHITEDFNLEYYQSFAGGND
jgi:hypothetical protein